MEGNQPSNGIFSIIEKKQGFISSCIWRFEQIHIFKVRWLDYLFLCLACKDSNTTVCVDVIFQSSLLINMGDRNFILKFVFNYQWNKICGWNKNLLWLLGLIPWKCIYYKISRKTDLGYNLPRSLRTFRSIQK